LNENFKIMVVITRSEERTMPIRLRQVGVLEYISEYVRPSQTLM
jgi:hypothetical protein